MEHSRINQVSQPAVAGWRAAPGYELTASFEKLGPPEAEALLRVPSRNRPVNDNRVAAFARMMRAGAWFGTNQGIAIGPQGQVFDGQHRLLAVIESGCTVTMLVVRNVAPEARAAIDAGGPRTTADRVAMFSDLPHPKLATSLCGAIAFLLHPTPPTLTPPDVVRWATANAAAVEWASRYVAGVTPGMRRALASVPVVAALAFAHPRDPNRIEEFAGHLAAGSGLSIDHPALVLRDYLASHPPGRYQSAKREASLKTLRAVRYFVEDQTAARLQPGDEGLRFCLVAHTAATLPPAPKPANMSEQDEAIIQAVGEARTLKDVALVLAQTNLTTDQIFAWSQRFRAQVPVLMTETVSEAGRRLTGIVLTARERRARKQS